MFEWLWGNKEWLFSGIGVAIATAILSGLVWSIRRKRQDSSASAGVQFGDVAGGIHGATIAGHDVIKIGLIRIPKIIAIPIAVAVIVIAIEGIFLAAKLNRIEDDTASIQENTALLAGPAGAFERKPTV